MVEVDAVFNKYSFTQQINVFGIRLVSGDGREPLPVAKLTEVATIMAEFLDTDEDGIVDDPVAVEAIQSNPMVLMMFEEQGARNEFFSRWPVFHDWEFDFQTLLADETDMKGQVEEKLGALLTLDASSS